MLNRTFIAVIALVASGSAFAGGLVETQVPVDHIYSPKGFDANDDTQVIVTGILPDLCHKAPASKAVVEDGKIHIRTTALKDADPHAVCPRAIVPFLDVVSVGVLDKGKYAIEVNGTTPYEQKGEITVAESTSSAVDEFIYASVESVSRKANTARTVVLRGYNPSDCFDLDRVEFVSNGKDTYSVLPILKQRWELCPLKLVPFEYEVEVPSEIARDEVLLHVRVMNGRSVNMLFRENE